jgi:hypothetical protein
MPDSHGPIAPDQQRRFERARSALEAMCPGWDRQHRVRKTARLFEPDPADLERVRWLLIAMGRARGAEGGRAIERLAKQGYAIGCQSARKTDPSSASNFDPPGCGRDQGLSRRNFHVVEAGQALIGVRRGS